MIGVSDGVLERGGGGSLTMLRWAYRMLNGGPDDCTQRNLSPHGATAFPEFRVAVALLLGQIGTPKFGTPPAPLRQTDRQTASQPASRHRQTGRKVDRQTDRQTVSQRVRQTYIHTDRQTDIQPASRHRQTDSSRHRQTDRQ